jgi:beta-lactamase superfamily II metal-dependent hydrolase
MPNRFFGPSFDTEPPSRLYALSIGFAPGARELFDAVDADALDAACARGVPEAIRGYGALVEDLPVYALEIDPAHLREDTRPAREARRWLATREARGDWVELKLRPDTDGAGLLYESIESEGRQVAIQAKPLAASMRGRLSRATRLTDHVAQRRTLRSVLPSSQLDGVVVLDVGQGSAAALVDGSGHVRAYVDLGAGVLRHAGTYPPAMQDFCLMHGPTVILSHWHYDHFHGANKTPQAQQLVWIAPNQTLGPGPQSAMAQTILSNGTLLLWNGRRPLRHGALTLERCTGSGQNRSGIAVWVEGPGRADAILLPGDAGYADIPSLNRGRPRRVRSLVVAHHGGAAPGTPPPDPHHADSRAVISCGHRNRYGHPLPRALTDLGAQGWSIGAPRSEIDDRMTQRRTRGLGHTGLTWGAPFPPQSCGCGCTIQATKS